MLFLLDFYHTWGKKKKKRKKNRIGHVAKKAKFDVVCNACLMQ